MYAHRAEDGTHEQIYRIVRLAPYEPLNARIGDKPSLAHKCFKVKRSIFMVRNRKDRAYAALPCIGDSATDQDSEEATYIEPDYGMESSLGRSMGHKQA